MSFVSERLYKSLISPTSEIPDVTTTGEPNLSAKLALNFLNPVYL